MISVLTTWCSARWPSGGRPPIPLTATATDEVRQDIVRRQDARACGDDHRFRAANLN
jgi:hypothetical protein